MKGKVQLNSMKLISIDQDSIRPVKVGPGLTIDSGTGGEYELHVDHAYIRSLFDQVTPPTTPQGVMDLEPRIPATLEKPKCGEWITDPVFGTKIVRLTDERDGSQCGTAYSYWPSFNADNSKIMVACLDLKEGVGVAALINFDPATNTIGTREYVSTLSTSPRLDLSGRGVWSATNPDIIFGVEFSPRIYSYSLQNKAVSVVKDFSTQLADEYLWQLHRSADDSVFSWTRRRSADYSTAGYAVWTRSDGLRTWDDANIDEVQIDRSGKYLVVKRRTSGPGVIESRIIDLSTGAITDLTDDSPGLALGHSDNGSGIQVGEENWTGRMWVYRLDTPLTGRVAIGPPTGPWKSGGHYALTGDGKNVLVSTAPCSKVTNPLEGELYLLRTDGSGSVLRLLHHRSMSGSYESYPKATISKDGRLVVFTSDWGSNRTDAYLAVIG